MPIQEPNQWEFCNLGLVMLALDQPLDAAFITDELEGNMTFPFNNEVCGGLYNYLNQINYVVLHLDHDYSDIYVDNMITWINNQVQ